jgi:hypothetical protein
MSSGASVKIKIPVNTKEPKKRQKKKKASAKPEVELSKLFDRVLTKLMSNPSVYAFIKPVNPALIKDYYDIGMFNGCLIM